MAGVSGAVCGVVMVPQQSQQQASKAVDDSHNAWVGTLAVLGMAGCSGLAGVYVESVLKARDSQFDLWDRNIQLSLYGLLFALLSMALTPSEQQFFATHSFFHGYCGSRTSSSAWAALAAC